MLELVWKQAVVSVCAGCDRKNQTFNMSITHLLILPVLSPSLLTVLSLSLLSSLQGQEQLWLCRKRHLKGQSRAPFGFPRQLFKLSSVFWRLDPQSVWSGTLLVSTTESSRGGLMEGYLEGVERGEMGQLLHFSILPGACRRYVCIFFPLG